MVVFSVVLLQKGNEKQPETLMVIRNNAFENFSVKILLNLDLNSVKFNVPNFKWKFGSLHLKMHNYCLQYSI